VGLKLFFIFHIFVRTEKEKASFTSSFFSTTLRKGEIDRKIQFGESSEKESCVSCPNIFLTEFSLIGTSLYRRSHTQ
jgi:hypothetical protein